METIGSDFMGLTFALMVGLYYELNADFRLILSLFNSGICPFY